MIQKRVIGCMTGVNSRASCKPLLILLKIISLSSLYIYLLIQDSLKHREGADRVKDDHDYNTK